MNHNEELPGSKGIPPEEPPITWTTTPNGGWRATGDLFPPAPGVPISERTGNAPNSQTFLQSLGLSGEEATEAPAAPPQPQVPDLGPGTAPHLAQASDVQGVRASTEEQRSSPNQFVGQVFDEGVDTRGLIEEGVVRGAHDPAADPHYRRLQRERYGIQDAPTGDPDQRGLRILSHDEDFDVTATAGTIGGGPSDAPPPARGAPGDTAEAEEESFEDRNFVTGNRPARRKYDNPPQPTDRALRPRQEGVPRSVADREVTGQQRWEKEATEE